MSVHGPVTYINAEAMVEAGGTPAATPPPLHPLPRHPPTTLHPAQPTTSCSTAATPSPPDTTIAPTDSTTPLTPPPHLPPHLHARSASIRTTTHALWHHVAIPLQIAKERVRLSATRSSGGHHSIA